MENQVKTAVIMKNYQEPKKDSFTIIEGDYSEYNHYCVESNEFSRNALTSTLFNKTDDGVVLKNPEKWHYLDEAVLNPMLECSYIIYIEWD